MEQKVKIYEPISFINTDANILTKILQFKSNKLKKVFLPKCKDASTLKMFINYNSTRWKVKEENHAVILMELERHGMNPNIFLMKAQ